jgi:DNA-binding MarR family transcriptional regulator
MTTTSRSKLVGYTIRNDPRQLDLVDWLAGKARTTDPVTSSRAAARVNVKRINGLILRVLRSRGPMTTEEISKAIRIRLQSVTPRMAPLVVKGFVRNTGKTRKGSSNRERIVWELVNAPN